MDDIAIAAYAAGIVDGEGCITVTYHKGKAGKHRPRFLPYVTVSNTKMEMINWLLDYFGGSYTTAYHGGNWNHCYTWYLCTRDTVRDFLETIKPYLVIKKPQLELLLAFLDLGDSPGKHNDLLEAKRMDLFLEMKILNKRGR